MTNNDQGKRQRVYSARVEEATAAKVLTARSVVYPWQCDHMGHMNVMWYVGKFDEATWQLIASLGLTPSKAAQQQIGGAAVDQHIEYKRELRAGDLITIRSSVVEVGEKSMRFFHEMRNDETGEVVATTTIVGVCIDINTRKSRPWPADMRERAARILEEGFNDAMAC